MGERVGKPVGLERHEEHRVVVRVQRVAGDTGDPGRVSFWGVRPEAVAEVCVVAGPWDDWNPTVAT